MAGAVRAVLLDQLDTAWRLLEFHLTDLSDAESLWRPTSRGPHVSREGSVWRADWPESEDYEIGAPSIAWLTWHIGFWWSMVLNHSFGDQTLQRQDIPWPGSARSAREWLGGLHEEWKGRIEALSDDELASPELTRWPMTDKPFYLLAGWLNVELMKNAAEIGYCRFLRNAAARAE